MNSLPSSSPRENEDANRNNDTDSEPDRNASSEPSEANNDEINSTSNDNNNSTDSNSGGDDDTVEADNVPTASSMFNQEVLRRRIAEFSQQNEDLDDPSADTVLDLSALVDDEGTMTRNEIALFMKAFDKLSAVWVIMFTNKDDGSEGVYSLAIGMDNIVLAFERREDAHRYAVCLEAQAFPSPKICEMNPKEMRDFCVSSDLKLGLITSGMAITPPEAEESAIDDLDSWSGASSHETGMSDDDIDIMRKRFDSIYGQEQ